MANSAEQKKQSKQSDPDGSFDEFLFASQRAIRAYSRQKYAQLAKLVRYDLRKFPQSGIFDDDHHRHLWDEYCLQVQTGPSQLEEAWEQTIQPHITHRMRSLPHSVAVLLTISEAHDTCDYECQDGETVQEEQISRGIWNALVRLADDNPQSWTKG